MVELYIIGAVPVVDVRLKFEGSGVEISALDSYLQGGGQGGAYKFTGTAH
jgi:hypothetical protein